MGAPIVAPHPPAPRVPPSPRKRGEGLSALFSLSPRRGERVGVRGICAGAFCGLVLALCFAPGVSRPQDTAAQEAAHRAELIAHLPHDAAKLVFGRETAPALGPAEAIGSYDRGCLEGAAALPADGPN